MQWRVRNTAYKLHRAGSACRVEAVTRPDERGIDTDDASVHLLAIRTRAGVRSPAQIRHAAHRVSHARYSAKNADRFIATKSLVPLFFPLVKSRQNYLGNR